MELIAISPKINRTTDEVHFTRYITENVNVQERFFIAHKYPFYPI